MIGEFYLDYAEILKVKYQISESGLRCGLSCQSDDKRLAETIITNLKNMSSINYFPESDSFRYKINDTLFVDISRTTGKITYSNKLSSFETRMLAQSKTNKVPFARNDNIDYVPKTDLHTHFAGAITSESLIDIGLKHNIEYPKWCLTKIGIDTSKYSFSNSGNINLRDITKEDIKILKNKMKLPLVTQETFNKMEEIYAIRGPFTKNKQLFADYLWELANDYKKNGVEYAELSFSTFLSDSEYMQILEDNLPKIEQETGVKIRFLAGFWRHSDKEWNLDDIDRLKSIAQSPYIVGCDFMGHETNSSLDLEEEMQELAKYVMYQDNNFVIRVHAGENPMFKTNVYDALKIIYDEHEKQEQISFKKLPMPQVRIGHGLYGLDITTDGKWNNLEPNAVLNLAKKMNAIVEFNMSSNLALNNINNISEVPIKRYIDEGVHVVLGTDGHGLYSTSGKQETLLANVAGLTIEDFNKMLNTERMVIEKAINRENTHSNVSSVERIYKTIAFSTPDGLPRYSDEVARKYKQEKINISNMLNKQIANVGAITDENIIERDIKEKIPIMITGASKSNWPNITEEDKYNIKVTMQTLANILDSSKTFIVTGGTNFGVEKTMHEAVNRRNQNSNEPMVLLGTLTMEAARNGDDEIKPNTITHATILEIDGHKANNWMDLPDTQLEFVQKYNGEMIAIGGGGVVNDMIQRAYNLGVDMHLMDGPYGASTNKSRSLEGNNYSFKTPQELIKRLYEKNPNYFSKNFSIDNINEYVLYAEKMINNQEILNDYDIDNESSYSENIGAISR